MEEIGLRGVFETEEFQQGLEEFLTGKDEAVAGVDEAAAASEEGGSQIVDSLAMIGDVLVVGGLALAATGLASLTGEIYEATSAAIEAEGPWALLDFQLEKLGDSANYTSDQLADLALETMKKTGIDDEEIAGIEAIALRYDNLNTDILPEFLSLSTDMAAVMGQSLRGAAMKLARGLNEPEKGMRLLRLAGVDVTDEMTDMVKGMVEAGDTAGAQAYLIGLLEDKFGGAAEAMAETFEGKMNLAKQLVGNMQEDIGEPFREFFKGILGNIITLLGSEEVQKKIKLLTAGIKFALDIVSRIFKGDFLNKQELDELPGVLGKVIGAVQTFVTLVVDNWPKIVTAFTDFTDWISEHKEIIEGVLVAALVAVGIAIWPVVTALGALIATTAAAVAPFLLIAAVAAAFFYVWNHDIGGIQTFVTDVWENSLKPALEDLWNWLKVEIPDAIDTLKTWWDENITPMWEDFVTFWDETLQPALQEWWDWFSTTLPEAITTLWTSLTTIWDTLTNAFSPSIEGASTNLSTLHMIIDKVATIFRENILPVIITVAETVGGALMGAWKVLHDFFAAYVLPVLNKLWQFITGSVIPIISGMTEVVSQLFRIGFEILFAYIENVVIPTLKKLGEKMEPVIAFIHDMWDKIANFLYPIVMKVAGYIRDTFIKTLETLSGWFEKIAAWIQTVIDKLALIKVPAALEEGSPSEFEKSLMHSNEQLQAMADLLDLTASYADMNLGVGGPGGGSSSTFTDNRAAVVNVYGTVTETEVMNAITRAEAMA